MAGQNGRERVNEFWSDFGWRHSDCPRNAAREKVPKGSARASLIKFFKSPLNFLSPSTSQRPLILILYDSLASIRNHYNSPPTTIRIAFLMKCTYTSESRVLLIAHSSGLAFLSLFIPSAFHDRRIPSPGLSMKFVFFIRRRVSEFFIKNWCLNEVRREMGIKELRVYKYTT